MKAISLLSSFLINFVIFFGNVSIIYADNSATVWSWNSTSVAVRKDGIDNAISIKNGLRHTLALKADGTVLSWGSNANGQLGHGALGEINDTPIQVKGVNGEGILADVVAIAAGDASSMALKKDGTIVVWGMNQSGILGTGIGLNDQNSIITTPQPVKISSNILADIKAISAGGYSFFALKNDGTVYAWGINDNGQLGLGCYLNGCSRYSTPTRINNLSNVIDISAGSLHTIVVKSDGSVFGWGRTYEGQLGPNTSNSSWVHQAPIQIQNLSNIKTVSAGRYHTLVLSNDGKLFQWGGGPYSTYSPIKTIDVNSNPNIVQISAGGNNGQTRAINLILDSQGNIWQWDIDNNIPVKKQDLQNVSVISAGTMSVPNSSVVGMPAPTATATPTPATFLDLPWDYKNSIGNPNKRTMDFSEAANAINSYFDHKYPFLCCTLIEPPEIVNYNNEFTTQGYTSHDGYDYGNPAQVKDGDPVLAAAAGDASLTLAANSFGAGNVIKIDHGNGYETIYEHMYYDNYLPVKTESTKVHVEKGQRIGTVGHFGKCWVYGSDGNKVYNTPACAHLHFGLVRDKNNDGNFNDNIPDGLSDPFGWEPLRDESSKDSDPWENYSFNYAGQQRTGVKSFYLWTTKLPGMRTQVDSTGGSFSSGKASIVVPPGTFTDPITLEMHDAPVAKASNNIWSVGPSVEITAKNLLGDAVTLLTKPVVLWWAPFKDTDVSRFKFGTLSVFSSNDGTHWTKEQRIDPYVPGAITTAVSHFTYFAVMGERKDVIPPVTNEIFDSEEGSNKWFRSDVTVSLSATDSADEDPAGVADTYYKLDGTDWQKYSEPLSFSNEGEYHISYYSEDNDGNIEDIKKVTFNIDKTVPQVSIFADPNIIWSPNGKMVPVTITGKSTDENLLKTMFNVQDEYNSVEPTLSNFDQTLNLEAKRNGEDLDGRVYTIQAIAEDLAGNKSTATTTITVPHDNNITN